MSIPRITEILDINSTDNMIGFRISNYASDYIYQGKCYSVKQRITVLSGTNMMILFNMVPAYDEGKIVSVYEPVFTTTTGPVNVDFTIGSDYTGGTSFNINNRAYYGDHPLCTMTYGATGSSKGVALSQDMVPAGHKDPGGTQGGLEFVPPQNTNVLAELDNTNGTDATVLVNFIWFEI